MKLLVHEKMMIALFMLGIYTFAKVGILLSSSNAMMTAPVTGIKAVFGTEIIELNMESNDVVAKEHCQKFKAENCKVVLVIGPEAAKVAVRELPDIAIVFCMIMNPDRSGVKGAKVTGVSLDIPFTRQFESFKSVVPSLSKIGLVYSDQISDEQLQEMKLASKKYGLTLVENKVLDEKEIPTIIRGLKGKIDGLYLPPDRIIAKHDAFQFIALFTFENNVPFMAPTSRFVKKGALVALMIDYEEIGKQAAEIARKILNGTPVTAIPIQPPEATILVLNQKTAETIGINIPPALTESSQIIK